MSCFVKNKTLDEFIPAKAGIQIAIVFFIITVPFLAKAAERFNDKHICNPELSNVAILECLVRYYEDIEQKRLVLEQESQTSAQSLEYDFSAINSVQYQGYAKLTQISRTSFETYRNDECAKQMSSYGAGSGAGHGKVMCEIKLTENRIKLLNHEQ